MCLEDNLTKEDVSIPQRFDKKETALLINLVVSEFQFLKGSIKSDLNWFWLSCIRIVSIPQRFDKK